MNTIYNKFVQLLHPFLVVFSSVGTIISLILGAIANPKGAVNKFLVLMIDNIATVFPETPDNLKVFNVLDSVGDSLPSIGRSIVYDVAATIASIVAIMIVVKIYKLIPFKAT